MCLSREWFEQSPQRMAKWDKEGVTPDDARGALLMIGSTVYPIAAEMAAWLYRHWTLEQIDNLGFGYRSAFLRAIGDPDVMQTINFDLGRTFSRARQVVALDSLPSPCLIRHRWKTPDIDQGEFLAIFRGTAKEHVILYGDAHFDSAAEWLKAVRAKRWNSNHPVKFRIDGTISGNWWEHVAIMREGRWAAIVESLPGLSANFD